MTVRLGRRAAMAVFGAGVLAARRAGAETDTPRLDPRLPAGLRESAVLDALPGKRPMIKLSWRPPNYESPIDAFENAITPNDLFFVRYHLAPPPEGIAPADWRITIGGDAAERSFALSLTDLESLPQAEVTAVCQCSGNRRGLFAPHVPGVQWGVGAMGAAVWQGPRLSDVLQRAGLRSTAVEIAFGGADDPMLDATPPFRKSLPVPRATAPDVLLALRMNGAPLPLPNGFPVRLVVPGWTATYWMKHLTRIDLRAAPLDSFWMRKAYRVPKGVFPVDTPFASQDTDTTSPITRIVVNSLVTAPLDGARVDAGGFDLRGLAWDGGDGIRSVEISLDGGATWRPATLGADAGGYAFRPFSMRVVPPHAGPLSIMVRATSNGGAQQPDRVVPNPAGYHHNVMPKLSVLAA